MPDLTTHSGYMDRFWELVSENHDNRAPMRNALNCVESELLQSNGAGRYNTYHSFSAAKSRRRRRQILASCKTV